MLFPLEETALRATRVQTLDTLVTCIFIYLFILTVQTAADL